MKYPGIKYPREYSAWTHMKQRCVNTNNPQYQKYGGRGIIVCDRWLNSFDNFILDVGKAPSTLHQLDRINNDGDYEPCNCRWVTNEVNSRNTNKSLWWWVDGVRFDSKRHAAEVLGVSHNVIYGRCNGQKPNCYTERKYERLIDGDSEV